MTPSTPTNRAARRRAPKHRAEPVRHPRSTTQRSTAQRASTRRATLPAATAILSVTALGAVTAAMGAPITAMATGAAAEPAGAFARTADLAAPLAPVADELIAAVDAEPGPTITGGLSATQAPFTGGVAVTVTGANLDEITQVAVGGAAAPILEATDEHVTFAVPATAETALGQAAVTFADAAGVPADVTTERADASPAASSVASASASTKGEASPEASASPSVTGHDAATDTLTLTYTTDPRIDAQVAYVLAHWSSYNSAEYPVISGYDCANFASQSLIARGWAMDGAWNVDRATGVMSAAWSSSTALRDYLRSRTDVATELADAQRDQVKVGDIAQFDWDNSGDRDHTAVVTRVEHTDSGTKVWVGGHTKDADYWDVDTALATGGGSVSYFSIR